ncbi:hypothetical protein HZC07_02510, partial [Candidatus Micrarchaeota archaeon]|nr:hypothetical protein [Candidatus Micrarchaeota archaeon]
MSFKQLFTREFWQLRIGDVHDRTSAIAAIARRSFGNSLKIHPPLFDNQVSESDGIIFT